MTAVVSDQISERAAALHARAIVWDNHACMPHRVEAGWMEKLEAHRAAGATFVSLNLGDADVPYKTQLAMAEHFRAWVAQNQTHYRMASSAADVRAAKASDQVSIAFDVEGAKALEDDTQRVVHFHKLGVRWLSPVFNQQNAFGGGVHDDLDSGLTARGAELIALLETTGISICCSHTGYRTAHDVLDVASGPVLFTHSNARAVHDHPRNIPDDLIVRCAQSGGVVGINGLSIFLGGKDAMLDRFVAHVEHVAGLIGANHVGIGLDFVFDQDDMNAQLAAARGIWPEGYGYAPGIQYLSPESLPQLTEMLLRRNWADADVLGLLGENFLRVAEQTWK